jgi:hypothetical protein
MILYQHTGGIPQRQVRRKGDNTTGHDVACGQAQHRSTHRLHDRSPEKATGYCSSYSNASRSKLDADQVDVLRKRIASVPQEPHAILPNKRQRSSEATYVGFAALRSTQRFVHHIDAGFEAEPFLASP